MHQSRLRWIGILLGGFLLPLTALGVAPAVAAPGLPPGYQVQRIDSPRPAVTGGFGNSHMPMGDVDGDGKDDFIVRQFRGSLNGDGVIWQFSGATGQVLRSVNAADGGGEGRSAGADPFLGLISDLGSCADAPTPVASQPGPTCASATVGPRDGVNEILVGSGGVDVGGVPDVGRVYVLDGKTLAVLKRIDMPPSDRAIIAARVAEGTSAARGGFGRTATSPRGLPPCAGNFGVGPCPTQGAIPTAVRIGDTDGGGFPDVIVGSNQFPETAATAHPESHCARTAGQPIAPPGAATYDEVCLGAGRAYVYRGEEIAGTDPSVVLDGTGPGQTLPKILKNIAAQSDDSSFLSSRTELLGHSQMPVGDVGACRSGGTFPVIAPGERCPAASRTTVGDGKPDYVISAHRTDVPIFNPDPAYFETGVAFLFDGATGALLYIYNNPEPVANALFGFTTGQQFPVGNLGDTAAPDVILAGFQNVQNKAQAGRGYVFSGNFTANFIMFATIDDPTPNTFGRFANPTEGVGDLVGGRQVGNEVLAGQFSAVQTANKEDTSFDVSFMNPANNQALQTISDPDDQPESGFGSSLMPLGDLNDDGFLDFAVASVRFDSPAVGGTPGVLDAGRLYIFRSDPNAVVPPPPGPPADPAQETPPATPPATPTAAVTPAPAPAAPPAAATPAGTTKFTAKLSIARTTINRKARVLDVLAPITARASGRVRVELHAAGRRFRFTAPIDSANGRIRFRQPIPAAQARMGTGILTISYAGDSDTSPQTVRLRAATRKANLRLERPRLVDNRVRASGTVDPQARGVVRVQLEYVVGGETKILPLKASISNGRWSLNRQLSPAQVADIGQRSGALHSYTLFTGYLPRRMRGEMRSFQILGDR